MQPDLYYEGFRGVNIREEYDNIGTGNIFAALR
jgi:hypothetical protein